MLSIYDIDKWAISNIIHTSTVSRYWKVLYFEKIYSKNCIVNFRDMIYIYIWHTVPLTKTRLCEMYDVLICYLAMMKKDKW